jgi:hypothetical protein
MKKLVLIGLALIAVVLLGVYSVRVLSRSRVQLSGTSCDEWARSYGKQIETQSLAILDNAKWPESSIDPAYDQLAFEVSQGLERTHVKYMQLLAEMFRDNPAVFADCSPGQFVAIVEQQLSPRFRQEVPPRFATLGGELDWAWYQEYLREQVNIGMHVYENRNRTNVKLTTSAQ